MLILAENNFEVFPEPILSLESLEMLRLFKNKLKEVPKNIINLQKLIEFDVDDNQI